MLNDIIVSNFKSFKVASMAFRTLSLLTGANASGKSNFLEAIRLLSLMARGTRFDDVVKAVQGVDSGIRGSLDRLSRRAHGSFGLTVSAATSDGHVLDLSIVFSAEGGKLSVGVEQLEVDGGMAYKAESDDSDTPTISITYNNYLRGKNKPRIVGSNQQLVLTQLTTPARFGANHARSQELIPKYCEEMRSFLERIFFLDPVPQRMRGYSFENEARMSEDGANLSAVLYGLCNEPRTKALLLQIVSSLPEQDISDIGFIRTPRSEVMVELEETFGGKKFRCDASLLSDGTLRVLAIFGAILTVPECSTVIIEEIDNGVHPSRASLLLDNIRGIAERRHLSVLLTSHNPALVDALPLSAVPDVVYCYRDRETGNSQIVRLEDLPNYPELVAQGTVGHLMTKGVLERSIKEGKSPDDKRKASLEWLASLKAEGA